MKSRSRLILAFLSVSAAVAALSASGAAQGHSGPGSRGAEVAERSIRKLVTEYERAWNTHDMEAWAALYTPDSDFVNRRGGWWDSRKVNTDHHTAIHNILADRRTTMDLKAELAKVDLLVPGIALAHITTVWPGAPASADHSAPPGAIMTWVVIESEEGWRIRAVQNTLVAPGPAPR